MRLKNLHIGVYEVSACLLIVAALVVRIVIAYLGWPQTDSDEGTMGLMALHIAHQGAHPLVLYGQDYMGTLEAYVGAVLFQFAGPSLLALRVGVILLAGLFLLCLYLLTCMLYTRTLALVVLVVLAFGSADVLFRQLEAVGGSPDVMLFGVLLMVLASWLAFSAQSTRVTHVPVQRLLAYSCFGLVAGLGIWSDPLILPFVAMAGLMVLLCCRQELRVSVVVLLLLGLLIGLAPEIIYKVTVPVNPNALSLLGGGYQVHSSGSGTVGTPGVAAVPALVASPWLQLVGTVLVSLPITTSANALCPLSASAAWPLSSLSSASTIQCSVVHGLWGLGWLVLWTIACVLAMRHYWRLWRQASRLMEPHAVGPLWRRWLRTPVPSQSLRERRAMLRQLARLMLLGAAGLTLLLYACFPQAALTPWPSSRYLVGVLIATPALLAPLWEHLHMKRSLSRVALTLINTIRYGLLVLIGTTFIVGTMLTFTLIPATQIHNQQQYTLIENLLRMGATRIYADYWTCNRIIFQSQEKILCSVLDEQLQPGLNRYLPYRDAVARDAHAYYVFPDPSPQASSFALSPANQQYRRLIFDGYVVYQPQKT